MPCWVYKKMTWGGARAVRSRQWNISGKNWRRREGQEWQCFREIFSSIRPVLVKNKHVKFLIPFKIHLLQKSSLRHLNLIFPYIQKQVYEQEQTCLQQSASAKQVPWQSAMVLTVFSCLYSLQLPWQSAMVCAASALVLLVPFSDLERKYTYSVHTGPGSSSLANNKSPDYSLWWLQSGVIAVSGDCSSRVVWVE